MHGLMAFTKAEEGGGDVNVNTHQRRRRSDGDNWLWYRRNNSSSLYHEAVMCCHLLTDIDTHLNPFAVSKWTSWCKGILRVKGKGNCKCKGRCGGS